MFYEKCCLKNVMLCPTLYIGASGVLCNAIILNPFLLTGKIYHTKTICQDSLCRRKIIKKITKVCVGLSRCFF